MLPIFLNNNLVILFPIEVVPNVLLSLFINIKLDEDMEYNYDKVNECRTRICFSNENSFYCYHDTLQALSYEILKDFPSNTISNTGQQGSVKYNYIMGRYDNH